MGAAVCTLGPFSAVFSNALTGSWILSGAAGTRTNAQYEMSAAQEVASPVSFRKRSQINRVVLCSFFHTWCLVLKFKNIIKCALKRLEWGPVQ